MAISGKVVPISKVVAGIKAETSFGVGLDSSGDEGTAFRQLPIVQVQKPVFNITRESRLLSGRGLVKNSNDTIINTRGGTVVMPFEMIATPKLLSQHLALVCQEHSEASSTIHTHEIGGQGALLSSLGGSKTNNIPHTVNLAYAPNASGSADGLKVVGAIVSDMAISGDYANNSGCLSMSGNYFSGFSNIQEDNGAGTRSQVNFSGTWTDPDENVFFHMGDLKTKTLAIDGGGALEMIVKGFSLNIANNVKAIGGDGSGNPEMYTIPSFDVTGNLVVKHDANFDLGSATNVLSSYLNKNTMALALKFGDNTVTSNGEMNIDAQIQLTGDPTLDNSDQGQFWNLPFECLQNDSTEALKITMFSTTAPTSM